MRQLSRAYSTRLSFAFPPASHDTLPGHAGEHYGSEEQVLFKFPSTATAVRLGAVLSLALAVLAVGGSASSSVHTAAGVAPAARIAPAVPAIPAVPAAPAAPGAPAAPAAAPCDHKVANNVCTRADSAQAESIWQGRIHLGDEPGIYGDAQFSGATAELPITLQATSTTGDGKATIIVQTKDDQTFSGYPGHSVVVILHT